MIDYTQTDRVAPWVVPPKYEDQGEAWRRNARALADWAFNTHVVRCDSYGRYLSEAEMARKPGQRQITAHGPFTETYFRGALRRHFEAADRGDLMGPLVYRCEREVDEGDGGEWAWCRVIAWDIDNHKEDAPQGHLDANHRFAQALYNRAKQFGDSWHPDGRYTPILSDSNGKGGFHLRMLFASPVLTPCANAFGKFLCHDFAEFGVQEPEVFPKQASPTGGRYGSWLRMLGKHHTRDCWSRVWDGRTWLDGVDAVNFLLRGGESLITGFGMMDQFEKYLRKPQPLPGEWGEVVKERAGAKAGGSTARSQADEEELNRELLKDALAHYTCVDLSNPQIVQVCNALKNLGDEGFDLFIDWIDQPDAYWRSSPNNYDEDYWIGLWQRSRGEVGLGTIFHHAEEGGWDRRERAREIAQALRAAKRAKAREEATKTVSAYRSKKTKKAKKEVV